MQLSIQDTQELLRIIDKNQLAIIGSELGDEFLTAADRELLQKYGIDPDKIYYPEFSSIDTSFHFGMLAEALGALEAKQLTIADLRSYVKEGKYLPISERQKATLANIKMQTFASVKAMNGKIFTDVNNVVVSKLSQQQFLADELKEGISKHKTVSQIAHSIAEKTGDWSRNFDRIIETESQNAFELGKAAEIERQSLPGEDPLVYKQPQNGACKHCIRLYLTNGMGSEPIIFKLSQLIANGSNIGRKAADWLAVVGTVHPFCRCPLMKKPEGFLWNKETRSFSIPDPEYKKMTEQQRKLIKTIIGGKVRYL